MPPRIFTATIQAAVLSATSNILAQLLKSYRSGVPFVLNTTPIFQFVLFTLLNTPPNFLWQEFLEDTFPAFTVSPVTVQPIDGTKGKGQELVAERKLNKRNTAVKFFLDQTVGALFNTVVFLAGMAFLRGADVSTAIEKARTDAWPLMMAGYKLWPMVSLLSFTVIPAQQRIVFGSLVGVAWGIFLSLFSG